MFGYEKALRILFTDSCNVYIRAKDRREDGVCVFLREQILAGVPCRVSYDTVPASKQNNRTAHTTGTAVLFLPAGIDVPAGSFVEIERDGRVIRLKASGLPKFYPGHTEITLKPADTEA